MTCPYCFGFGSFGPVYKLTGSIWIPEGPCLACNGTGKVEDPPKPLPAAPTDAAEGLAG